MASFYQVKQDRLRKSFHVVKFGDSASRFPAVITFRMAAEEGKPVVA